MTTQVDLEVPCGPVNHHADLKVIKYVTVLTLRMMMCLKRCFCAVWETRDVPYGGVVDGISAMVHLSRFVHMWWLWQFKLANSRS